MFQFPIAAESESPVQSFKWIAEKTRSVNSLIFKKLFFEDAVDLVLSCEITNMPDTLAFGFEAKNLPNKTLDKYSISIACWQNSKNITAGETQFQRFSGLAGSSSVFSRASSLQDSHLRSCSSQANEGLSSYSKLTTG